MYELELNIVMSSAVCKRLEVQKVVTANQTAVGVVCGPRMAWA